MHSRLTLTSLLMALVLFLAACSNGGTAEPEPASAPELTERVAMLMGGWPHAKAITETGKATAFRIGKDDQFKEVMLSDGIALTDAQRAELVELLARDDAYAWDIGKGCEPMPGVLVTFEDGATYARLRICFGCQMLGFKPGNWEDFDPVNKQLVAWVKGVFPDDKAIQSLGTDAEESGL